MNRKSVEYLLPGMKKRWVNIGIILLLFSFWRIVLAAIEYVAPFLWPVRQGYLGATHWANFDGVHYVSIAQWGYRQFMEAFFPLYPLLMRYVSYVSLLPLDTSGVIISHLFFFFGLIYLYKLAAMEKDSHPLWTVVFVLFYPLSFFFASVYPSSLYFFLSTASFYYAKKKNWSMAGVAGFFAALTRVFGVFLIVGAGLEFLFGKKRKKREWIWLLLIPLGLAVYMGYLLIARGDPLAFYHVQPAFGADRSAGEIILLPQVIWRYFKIITTASSGTTEYWVAVVEIASLLFSVILLWIGYRKKISPSYLWYIVLVILLPTLTGTLSSLPRYVVSAFPLFIILGSIRSVAIKTIVLVGFMCALVLLCSLFLQGYFVS